MTEFYLVKKDEISKLIRDAAHQDEAEISKSIVACLSRPVPEWATHFVGGETEISHWVDRDPTIEATQFQEIPTK